MAEISPTAIAGRRSSPGHRNLAALAIATLAVAAGLAVLTGGAVMSPLSLSSLGRQVLGFGIAALGSLPLIMLGTIDLSVTTVAAISTILVGVLIRSGVPIALAIAIVLGLAAVAGLLANWLASPRRPGWLPTAVGIAGAGFGLVAMLTDGLRTAPNLQIGFNLLFYNIVTLALIAAGLWLWSRRLPGEAERAAMRRTALATLGVAGCAIAATAILGAPYWGNPMLIQINSRYVQPVFTLVLILLVIAVWAWRRALAPASAEAAAPEPPLGGRSGRARLLAHLFASIAAALSGLPLLLSYGITAVNLNPVAGNQLLLLAALLFSGAFLARGSLAIAATLVATVLAVLLVLGPMQLFPIDAYPQAYFLLGALLFAIVWALVRHALAKGPRRHAA